MEETRKQSLFPLRGQVILLAAQNSVLRAVLLITLSKILGDGSKISNQLMQGGNVL